MSSCLDSDTLDRELEVQGYVTDGRGVVIHVVEHMSYHTGQIVLLAVETPPFRHVIEVGRRYLVPRPDGRVLIGSTEEWAGFNKCNTAGAVAELLRFAVEVVPALAAARYERAWAGLRPRSLDGLPYLGRVPDTENLFVATGHFRSGLQMSPATAVLMRQLILAQEVLIPLDAFSPGRRPAEMLPSS